MKTECYSYSGNCPCINCNNNCCSESTDEYGLTDTEKLCRKARKHCEKCALSAKENEHDGE